MTSASQNERIQLLRADFERVVSALSESLAHSNERFARDSSLLHFNLSYEVAWKLIQAIATRDGVDVVSPRAAFGYAHRAGWITDEVTWDRIVRTRNDTVHLYRASMAQSIYGELPSFLRAFDELHKSLVKV